MDFLGLSNDELAAATGALLATLHDRAQALPESAFKSGILRRLDVAHKGMDLLREHAVNGGLIRPDSGGSPK